MLDEVTVSLKETQWLLLQATLDNEARRLTEGGQLEQANELAGLAYHVRGQAMRSIGERHRRREIKTRLSDTGLRDRRPR